MGERASGLKTRRRLVTARQLGLPVVFLLCVTLPHLADGDWMRGDSGWYAAIALQAWRTGELWTLWAEPGQHYFNKPPLVFWLVGLVMHVFGASAWTARLSTVFAAGVCVLLTVGVAQRLSGRATARCAGIVLALTYEFFRRTREISLDMWQLVFLLATVWLVARGVGRSGDRGGLVWMLGAGVPLGLALMTKPLVGLVALPLLAVWLVWMGRRRQVAGLGLTLAAALVVAAPWHVSMARVHGSEFVSIYFGAEIGGRAAGESFVVGSSDDWAFYLKQLVESYWPWLVFVVLCLVSWARRGMVTRHGGLERLAVVWAGGWLTLISVFPDRRDRYALVVFPALAWLAAIWLMRLAPAWWRRLSIRSAPILTAGIVAVALVVSLLPIRVQRPIEPHWPAVHAWVDQEGVDGLWQGGFGGAQAARFSLRDGWWPSATRDRFGALVAEPSAGALLIYHADSPWGPGPGEAVVFESGAIRVTRLDAAMWSPVRKQDQ